MATINLGRIKLVNKGTWSNSTAYAIDDFVQYTDNGVVSTYIAVAASTNQTPSTSGTENSNFWKYLAKGVAVAVGNNKVVTSDASGNLQGTAIGSAGEFLRTNSSANGFEFAAVPSTLLQRKFHFFNDGLTAGSSGGWHNMGHPLGDGTLTITPTAANNIIEIQFSFFVGHQDTWQASTQRLVVSTDGGSSYSTANGLGSSGGYGGALNYLSGSSRVGDVHCGVVWHAAANTNAHKFKWQYYGASGGQGFYVNSYESNNAGGTAYSNIIISEYDVSSASITNGGAL